MEEAWRFVRSQVSEEYLILEQFFGYFFGSIDVKHVEPRAVLHIESRGHALHAFINGKLSGSGIGNNSTKAKVMEIPSTLIAGKNTIDLLILTVGLKNYGAFFDTWGAGIIGPVQLKGLKNGGTLDLSSQRWTYQVGLKGEELGLSRGSSGRRSSRSALPKKQPLTWYKTTSAAPSGGTQLPSTSRGGGRESIERYWPTYVSPNKGCTDTCDYKGTNG